jgi:RimJ/RimL family protein N-acetyltransferase
MSDLNIRQGIIETPRLELHHISGAEVISLFETPEDIWIYEGKSYTNPYRQLMDDSGPLAWRVPQVKADPTINKWFVRWIVLKSSNEIIGSSSFHGAPNENGTIEIGLGIDPKFHNLGFGFEALTGMWRWVCAQEGVKILRYTVSITNLPSIALVNKFGFTRVGEQLDEIDGPEEIYEMSSAAFAEMHLSSN